MEHLSAVTTSAPTLKSTREHVKCNAETPGSYVLWYQVPTNKSVGYKRPHIISSGGFCEFYFHIFLYYFFSLAHLALQFCSSNGRWESAARLLKTCLAGCASLHCISTCWSVALRLSTSTELLVATDGSVTRPPSVSNPLRNQHIVKIRRLHWETASWSSISSFTKCLLDWKLFLNYFMSL